MTFTFNWTKVELKLSEIEKIIETQQSFNWTKVELKLQYPFPACHIGPSFNWTKVELKLISPVHSSSSKKLLIELR